MCGRYAATANPDELVLEFEVDDDRSGEPGRSVLVNPQEPPAGRPDHNMAPTKRAPVVLARAPREDRDAPPRRQLRLLTWGLVPSWSKDPGGAARMINARVESVADKPAFARALASRRCLVPARGWYEWQASPTAVDAKGKPRKQPFFTSRVDGTSVAMAGLYEFWRDRAVADPDDPLAWLTTFTVVTGPAEPGLDRIHDRQPLVLEQPEWSTWLDPATGAADVLGLLEPRRPRAVHGLPGVAGGQQQPVQRCAAARPGAGRRAGRGGRPDDRRGARRARMTGAEPAGATSDRPAQERLVDTPLGPARATTTRPDGIPAGALVLGHGAGGLRWTLDVLATRDAAVAAGWVVVLVDQPWRVAGKKLGPAPASLDLAWLPVLAALAPELGPGPLVVGGRSAGARVACRTAAAVGAGAVVALSFPLHPPGAPDRSRAPELAMPSAHGIPVHVVQGRTDPFGTPAEVEAVLPTRRHPRRRHRGALDRGVGGSGGRAGARAAGRRLTHRRGMPPRGRALTDLSSALPGKVRPSCSSSTPQPPAGPG